MCGIAGFYQLDARDASPEAIQLMISKMLHRGPDDGGTYVHGPLALGHRRLSILDLSASGHQPMFTPDRELGIVYNGEIYNYSQIKHQLIAAGYNFQSFTDTEVILHGFKEWGVKLFAKLNGIFAFALWDAANENLYLVRDRLGVKPLYIHKTASAIYFASEIKAIRAVCPQINRIDNAAFSEFLYYGNALGNKTLFHNVESVKQGHYIIINGRGLKTQTFWQPEDVVPSLTVGENDVVSHTRYLLEEAVKRQLVSDVPVGVFLSGGIDSSAIVAFASKHYPKKLKTFSASFEYQTNPNELIKAASVAKHFNTDHQEFFVGTNDLPQVIEKMVYHHDEPFSDAANIPLYLMAMQVKPFASVVLQGDGGDEIFAGYRRYQLLKDINSFGRRQLLRALDSITGKINIRNQAYQRVQRMVGALSQKDDAMLMALLLTVDTLEQNTSFPLTNDVKQKFGVYDPFGYYKLLNERFRDKDIVQRMLYIDTQIILPNTFLEKVDKATMAASVEVRVPLLDNDLVNYVMGLPSGMKIKNGEKKWLLKKALRGVVPDNILDGPKTGFGVPYENWLRKPLYELMNDSLRTEYIKSAGLFDYKKLDKMINEHRTGMVNHGFSLWKLMNLCMWMEMYKVVLCNE